MRRPTAPRSSRSVEGGTGDPCNSWASKGGGGDGGATPRPSSFFSGRLFFRLKSSTSTIVGYPPTAVGYPPTAVGYPPTAVGYPPTAVDSPPTVVG